DPRVISRIHAGSVYLFCVLLIALLAVLHRSRVRRETTRAAWALAAFTVAQGAIGYTQYLTGLPELLVFFHLAGAAMFAAGIAWVGTRLLTWQAPAGTAAGSAAPTGASTQPSEGAQPR